MNFYAPFLRMTTRGVLPEGHDLSHTVIAICTVMSPFPPGGGRWGWGGEVP